MEKIKLREIKKEVLLKGGSYKKLKILINGNDAYKVNDKIYTKPQLRAAYLFGDL